VPLAFATAAAACSTQPAITNRKKRERTRRKREKRGRGKGQRGKKRERKEEEEEGEGQLGTVPTLACKCTTLQTSAAQAGFLKVDVGRGAKGAARKGSGLPLTAFKQFEWRGGEGASLPWVPFWPSE